MLPVTNRQTVHQWHISSLTLNGRHRTVRRENFISTNFGVTLEQHANTIIIDHNVSKNLAVRISI